MTHEKERPSIFGYWIATCFEQFKEDLFTHLNVYSTGVTERTNAVMECQSNLYARMHLLKKGFDDLESRGVATTEAADELDQWIEKSIKSHVSDCSGTHIYEGGSTPQTHRYVPHIIALGGLAIETTTPMLHTLGAYRRTLQLEECYLDHVYYNVLNGQNGNKYGGGYTPVEKLEARSDEDINRMLGLVQDYSGVLSRRRLVADACGELGELEFPAKRLASREQREFKRIAIENAQRASEVYSLEKIMRTPEEASLHFGMDVMLTPEGWVYPSDHYLS